ncbi:MAG TPA: metallophosphoesterase family protein [Candidatus Eisenbacteria bacterium]|nr:metallophosphoesterase family protein [Candidatus Eisenbacteria bacterium]
MTFARVACLYDVHGNLPALEAVLGEARRAGVDLVVVGGDVMPGPMSRECLDRLLNLDLPVRFIHGNCELAVLALRESMRTGAPVSYWGTTSGRPLQSPHREPMEWAARQLTSEHERAIAGWPRTERIEVAGLGTVLFCHGTPRSETEVFSKQTAEQKLKPVLDGLGASVAVCGHTHMPFDRMVGATRVVNAGSVGAPFGAPGAYWLLLGPGVEPRRTDYDLAAAAEAFRSTTDPGAAESAKELLQPPAEADMLALYATAELSESRAS